MLSRMLLHMRELNETFFFLSPIYTNYPYPSSKQLYPYYYHPNSELRDCCLTGSICSVPWFDAICPPTTTALHHLSIKTCPPPPHMCWPSPGTDQTYHTTQSSYRLTPRIRSYRREHRLQSFSPVIGKITCCTSLYTVRVLNSDRPSKQPYPKHNMRRPITPG